MESLCCSHFSASGRSIVTSSSHYSATKEEGQCTAWSCKVVQRKKIKGRRGVVKLTKLSFWVKKRYGLILTLKYLFSPNVLAGDGKTPILALPVASDRGPVKVSGS